MYPYFEQVKEVTQQEIAGLYAWLASYLET